MDRKKVLVRTAKFAKKHKLPVNVIVVMFAVIILSCYFKDFVVKIVRQVLKPFIYIYDKCKSIIADIIAYCRRHKIAFLRAECTILALCAVCMYIIQNDILDDVWGNDNSGVYAEETQAGELKEEQDTQNVEVESQVQAGVPTGKPIDTTTEQVENDTDGKQIAVTNKDGILPYYIKVNRVMNTITVYTIDESGYYTVPYLAFRCATGGENTPLGTYALSDKYAFATLLYNSYGQYCTRIDGPILFHSSTYTALTKDSLSAVDYNQLGEGVSHGCIRLTVKDAKWIFDNCAEGTLVTIYDDEVTAGPLGKPETITVPEWTVWDPTDPDPNNPWNLKSPEITGATDKVVYESDGYDVMDGIKAYDTCGNDITEDIQIEGYVDISIPGVYIVKYRVTDLLERSDEVTVEITVR